MRIFCMRRADMLSLSAAEPPLDWLAAATTAASVAALAARGCICGELAAPATTTAVRGRMDGAQG